MIFFKTEELIEVLDFYYNIYDDLCENFNDFWFETQMQKIFTHKKTYNSPALVWPSHMHIEEQFGQQEL